MSKIKNIIILVVVGTILVFVYFSYIKRDSAEQAGLISSSLSPIAPNTVNAESGSSISQDFLTLLLGVRNIKLADSIFSDVAFTSLDSSHSITLTPDGTEGRANPFAPLGTDAPVSTTPASTTTTPASLLTPITN